MPDLAGALGLGEHAHRVGEGYLRIRGVKLIEVDALEPQALQAPVQRPAQMLGAAVRVPTAPARSHDPALGADDEALRIGIQGFRDEGFGSVRPVAVGGVEEIDSELERPMQQELRRARIGRRAPMSPPSGVTRIAPKPTPPTVWSPRRRAPAGGGWFRAPVKLPG